MTKHTPRHGGHEPRQWRCPSGKRRFDNEADAERAREEQEMLNMDLRLSVYRCNEIGCNGWHLTRRDSAAK